MIPAVKTEGSGGDSASYREEDNQHCQRETDIEMIDQEPGMANSLDREGERGPQAACLGADSAANASSDAFEPSAATAASQTATGARAAAFPPLLARHMPREPRKFSIPRKTKEKKGASVRSAGLEVRQLLCNASTITNHT